MAGAIKSRYSPETRFYCFIMLLTFLVGLLPFVFNYVVDPYEMNRVVDAGFDKKKVSEKAHYPLWKVIHYPAIPPEVIILGDSRARSLRDQYWQGFGYSKAYNFGYGAATMREVYDTFQFAKDNKNLKSLVIGVQLRSFRQNDRGGMNRVPEAIRLGQNPLKYYSNWFVLRVGVELLKKEFGPIISKMIDLGVVSLAHAESASKKKTDPLKGLLEPESCENCMLPENVAASIHPALAIAQDTYFGADLGMWSRLWLPIEIDRELTGVFQQQVLRNANSDWRSFKFSEKNWSYLVEISKWSKQNNVQLIFVIPPTISEMQSRVVEFGYGALNHDFRKRLLGLGDVVDFDFDSPFTRDLTRFTDAYHFNFRASRLIVGEILQLVSNDQKAVAKARKRRKDIICPVLPKDITNKNSDDFMEVTEGQSCRIWRARHG
ncbi:MAG: hypothetical protein COA52_03155 [Hyphomicrobiales bacterium]|nr:MAG: hypothetical protein COA52_03155 [Hyphomicrobiales bacterium]